MAVAYSGTRVNIQVGSATTSTANAGLTVSGTNPAILVPVVILDATGTVSSITWSLGSGTPYLVVSARGGSGNSTYSAIWVVPAPTGGAGTITINMSGSIVWAGAADLWTGCDQTTPCPTAAGDTASDITSTQVVTLTPTNLTASDGCFLCGANSSANITSVTPNQTLVNNAGSIDIGSGYNTGGSGTTITMSSSADAFSRVAARIVPPAAPADTLLGQIWL